MKKQMRLSKYIYLFFFMLLLSGCWDQKRIEESAYVVAIGLDKAEEEGKVTITYLISNPEYGSQQGGGTTNEPPQEIISFQTNDLITSKNTANAVIAKEITYDLLSVMIVSEDLAKDEDFARWMYDATKDREISRRTSLIITKEKASKFLTENKPKQETRAHKYFNNILKHGIKTGFIPKSDLYRYFKIMEEDADLFLAVYGTTETKDQKRSDGEEDQFIAGEFHHEGKTNKTQFLGSAVFKEGKMIGKLTGEETRHAVTLNDTYNISDFYTTYPDPFDKKYRIATRIKKIKNNDVKMRIKNGVPTIDVTIPLYVEVLSDHSMVNYAKNSEKRNQLKKYLEKKISNKSNHLITKTQEKFKGDPFGWSLIARKHFTTIPEYEKFGWMKSYPDMKVKVTVKIRFGEFGRQSELPEKRD
ncbi:Ger(x)C family spore germination protein [Peribacillus frigoritolerans]|uniref:Ger(x)C family spore germination protein n=1 Tax=Peribacillus frigoritolerans TaxID=450367 RepID=UPI0039A1D822